jgi:hypothetical protein
VLTPIVAVAAIVVALSTNTGDGSQGSAAGGGGNASVTGGAADAEASPRGFLSVSGPADDVAARLRSRGIDARAVGTTVEVRHASRDQVRAALAARRKGRVQVIIVHK